MFLGSLISQSNNMFVSPRDRFIGAWDFTGNLDSNIITGGYNLNTSIFGYSLATISSEHVIRTPVTNTQRIEPASRNISIFSFAGFIYQDTQITPYIRLGLSTEINTPCLSVDGQGTLTGNTSIYPTFTPDVSSPFHICVSYNGSIAKVYKNGSLSYSGSISLGTAGSGQYFGVIFPSSDNYLKYVDNLVLSDTIISDRAISLLASGAMPKSDGYL